MKGSITFLTLCLVAAPIQVIGQDFSSSDVVIPYTQRQDIPGTCRDGQIIRLIPSNVDVLLRCKAGKYMPFGNIGITTFAAPPPFPQTNSIYLMTDATSTGTCSGGGSAYALCVWNGSAFVTPGGGGSGGAGTFIVTAGGTPVPNSPATTADTVAGTGVTCTPTVDSSHVWHQQCSADPAVLAFNSAIQTNTNPQICISASASGTVYTASCAISLSAYSTKQNLFWYADTTNSSTTPTLNIDTLGAKTLVKGNGTALANGDIVSGSMYRIWYDGTHIRVVEAGIAGAVGVYAASLGNTGTISLTGSNTIWSVSSVPAMASGACRSLEFTILNNSGTFSSGSQINLLVDGTSVVPLTNSGGTGGEYEWMRYLYCNNPTSQAAQTLVGLGGSYCDGGSCLGSPFQWTGIYWTGVLASGLSNVDWTVSHTLAIQSTQSSGTVTGLAFRIGD